MQNKRLVVIGASAGGVTALLQLTAALPADFSAAVLIVLHIGAHPSLLPRLLGQKCLLPVAQAQHGEPIAYGEVRIAPPDHHLLVQDSTLLLSRGPKEYCARPAIDPLFRSAALAHGPAVVGVVLTGLLDDGTAGLQVIKQRGGVAVVQDPEGALEPSMPRSALEHVDVDHCLSLNLMPLLLQSLAAEPAAPATAAPPQQAVQEQALAAGKAHPLDILKSIAAPSPFACPDCHGGLWELLDSRPTRYRCHTGHAFTERSLEHALGVACDQAAWNALRALQEEGLLLEHVAEVRRAAGATEEAERLLRAAERVQRQSQLLRALVEEQPAPSE